MGDHDAADVFSGLGEAGGFMDDFVAEPPHHHQHHSSHPTAAATATTAPSALDGMPSTAADSRDTDDPFYTSDPSNWASLDDSPSFEPCDAAAAFGSGFAFPQSWDFTLQFLQQPTRRPLSAIGTPTIFSTVPFGDGASTSTAAAAANAAVKAPKRPQTGPNTLTPAQREKLKSIAMPSHIQYHSPKCESGSESKGDSASSPEGPGQAKPASRKRKASADDDDDDDDDDQPVKKTAHNMIEKRYRTNLNDKIAALRDSVPSLRIMSKSARGEDTTEDREELHGLTPAHKLNKATVLSKATEYIRHLEKRNGRLLEENNAMQERIAAFEKLFMAGAMNGTMSPGHQPATPVQYTQEMANAGTLPVSTQGAPDAKGMIQVPDDMKRILAAQKAMGRPYPVPQQSSPQSQAQAVLRQQVIQTQQQQEVQAQGWQAAGPYFGKLMVGSLAALMVVEAVRENEQGNEKPEGRGLLGLPLQLLTDFVSGTHFTIGSFTLSTSRFLYQLKLLLLFGALLWVFVPSLFATKPPRPQEAKHASASLEAVPSLASPIHVRRQAWLTAIQTVWVPRHNFLLEAAALLLKTMKLSLRNVIGIHGCQVLTGLTEDQELARVKAWNIALDAQLAGGDVEISKSRLTLTLLASGTLADTPHRLMLKALHIRILLWELGDKGLHNLVASHLARSRWNEARRLNRVLSQQRRSTNDASEDELPDHLALLLEEDCDDVLNDEIVRRAHNLAWNRPTTHKALAHVDGMNGVVEDPAVRSPMDAVAAWWSCLTLQQTLSASLASSIAKDDDHAEETRLIETDLDLAVKVAPIGSNAQVRALVARAVLVDLRRGANIATALQAIASTVNPDEHPSYSSGVPPLIDSPASSIVPDPDVQMALRCAMGIAHLRRFAAPPKDALLVIDSILPGPSRDMSLLGCTAAFRLMSRLHLDGIAAEACAPSLERLAGSLRLWIGGATGDRCGLDQAVRHTMVDRCLAITKSAVGMDPDPGYGSMSDCDAEDGGC